jgi:hypothetical protein
MIRQYYAPRHRLREVSRGRWVPVGTVEVGTIFRLFPEACRDCHPGPWILEGWLPRETFVWDRVQGSEPRYLARFGHLAQCRNLATGQRLRIAYHWISQALEV